MKLNVSLGCGAILLLSACGGSNSDPVAFSALQARGNAFEAAIGAENLDEPTLAVFEALPQSGSFGYTGIAYVGLADPDFGDPYFTALGSAKLVADFDDQSISGTADNFFQIDDPNVDTYADMTGERIAGTLTYDLDQIGFQQNAYAGTITGSVTPTDLPTINVETGFGGAFFGDNAQAFAAGGGNEAEGLFVGIAAIQD